MRCFVGIDVGAYRQAFGQVALPANADVNPVKNYHITLNFWKDLDKPSHTRLSNRIATFSYMPFVVCLDTLMAFPSSQTPELYALSPSDAKSLLALREAFMQHVDMQFTQPFRPHVTLARKEIITPSHDAALVRPVAPVHATIDSITLFDSSPERGMNTYFTQTTHFT